MPKKGFRRHKTIPQGEVTIQDFADNTTSGGRTKKVLNNYHIGPKSFQVLENLLEDIVSLDIDDDIELNAHGKKKRKSKEEMDPNHVYNDYHIDIWFLISEHVKPEDTGRFALICKKTEAVVCSARYWSNLYKKYYNPRYILPDRLNPERMERIGGLRARVICSLYFIYPTLSLRLSKPERNNLNYLENMQCIEMRYRRVKEGMWMFCYRFSNRIKVRKPFFLHDVYDSDGEDEEENDILDRLEKFLVDHNNVFENRYEGQHLLIITSDRFIPFPEIQINESAENNITLELITQPLSKNLRHKGLQMNFINKYRNAFVACAHYEKVLDYRTVDWWDPEFWLFSDF